MKKNIPNLITLLNLASGFTAIIFIVNGKVTVAVCLVFAAMVFDFADGLTARLLRVWSDLGKELDSLSDIVSFGITPGLLVYTLGSGINNEFLRITISALLPLFAAIRLARFNITAANDSYFNGMPVPAAALAVVSLIPASVHGSRLASLIVGSPVAVALYTTAVAIMMVIPVRMISLKMKTLNLHANYDRYLLIAASTAAIVFAGWGGLFLIIPFYIIISLVRYISL